MKRKATRRALVMSLLSLLLCMSMLVGTTFAWFTDSVTSGRNQIVAGNLDIEMNYLDKTAGGWQEVTPTTKLFNDNALWEPGHTEIAYLQITNAGSLALKYQLAVKVYEEIGGTNVDEESFKLSDHLVFKVIDIDGNAAGGYTRDEARAMAGAELGLEEYNSGVKTLAENGDTAYVMLVIYMPETVGNEANYLTGTTAPSISMGVELNATQKDFEEDSFGSEYDKDAVYADSTVVVDETTDFAAALAAAAAGDDATVLITLNKDVEWQTGAAHGSTPWIGENATVSQLIVDANGHKITATGAGVGPIRMANGGMLTIKNAVIDDKSESYAEGSWEFGYLEFEGKVTFDNCDFVKAIMVQGEEAVFNNCSFNSHADNEYAVWVYNGTATFKNSTFTGPRGLKLHEQYGSEIAEVSVDSCIFENITKKPGIAIGTVNAQTTVSIKNSVFANTQAGDQGNYKYESDTDTTTFTFSDENNAVSKVVEVTATDAASLSDALSGAGQAGAGSTVVKLPGGKIDLTGESWTPIKVDGYHGADIVTIDGNNTTITGLTAPLFAGGFAGGSGIVIKNLTIADSAIVSTHGYGSGAFIEYIDSMNLITLTNCHLKNSTVTGSRTGGLIGYTTGYNNINDGPVKTYVTVEDCSVIDCKITGEGSVGGIIGHSGANAWTFTVVKNCAVKNNTLYAIDNGGWRVGVAIGTVNVGEQNDLINITESGNTLTQTGATAPAGQSNLYGRFVPGTTGGLTIDGVAITN